MVSEANDSPVEGSSTIAPQPSSPAIPTAVPLSSTVKFDLHPVSIKLSDDNYLTWKQQAMATIKGYKLQRFILGAHAIPSQFSSPADEASGNFNEAFLNWE